MANHIRQQIRQALASRLNGMAATADRVFTSHVYPIADTELPGLLIKNGNEQSELSSLGTPAVMSRSFEIMVQAVAKSNSNIDDMMDTICKEVETAVASDSTFGGLVSGGMQLIATDFEISGDGEHPIGLTTMTWQASYHCLNNAPDTAI